MANPVLSREVQEEAGRELAGKEWLCLVNVTPPHRKFWRIRHGHRFIECRWGRIGSQGQRKLFVAQSWRVAVQEFSSKVQKKLASGYRRVTEDDPHEFRQPGTFRAPNMTPGWFSLLPSNGANPGPEEQHAAPEQPATERVLIEATVFSFYDEGGGIYKAELQLADDQQHEIPQGWFLDGAGPALEVSRSRSGPFQPISADEVTLQTGFRDGGEMTRGRTVTTAHIRCQVANRRLCSVFLGSISSGFPTVYLSLRRQEASVPPVRVAPSPPGVEGRSMFDPPAPARAQANAILGRRMAASFSRIQEEATMGAPVSAELARRPHIFPTPNTALVGAESHLRMSEELASGRAQMLRQWIDVSSFGDSVQVFAEGPSSHHNVRSSTNPVTARTSLTGTSFREIHADELIEAEDQSFASGRPFFVGDQALRSLAEEKCPDCGAAVYRRVTGTEEIIRRGFERHLGFFVCSGEICGSQFLFGFNVTRKHVEARRLGEPRPRFRELDAASSVSLSRFKIFDGEED